MNPKNTLNPFNPKLILGLGNPGKKYESTYHNAGHLFIDYLIKERLKGAENGLRSKGSLVCLKTKDQLIGKSLTYMNLSGISLENALKIRKTPAEEILIVHDDSDIPIGSYKLSFGKNSAGHKGVDSIIRTLGSKYFWRLRVGIRPAKEKTRSKAENFVLKKINADHKKILYSMFGGIIEKVIEKENP